jgi:hypothetical protein
MAQQRAGQAEVANGAASARERDELTIILDQTRETLELMRSLVAMLLPRESGKDGPKLEDLIAALVAQQRDTIIAIKRLQGDVTAIADHVLAGGTEQPGGHAGINGIARA